MHRNILNLVRRVSVVGLMLNLAACASLPFSVPELVSIDTPLAPEAALAEQGFAGTDSEPSSASQDWRQFFNDDRLSAIIEDALKHNQELNVLLQDIEVAKAEVTAREGAYRPFASLGAGIGVEKAGRYTREGAVEEGLEIRPGEAFPEPLADFQFGAAFSWELDIWKKLRNESRAAALRYLATREGRNFMVTHLVAELAEAWYELMALDSQLTILQKNIAIQSHALETVRLEKDSARVTELAVRRFEAEVAKNQSRVFDLQQAITVTENRINYLAGRYPQPIDRSAQAFEQLSLPNVHPGSPRDLLLRRPDVRQAELALTAARLDVQAARARFFPRLDLSGLLGFRSFRVASLLAAPESLLYGVAADLMVPLINRSQIEAAYQGASAEQLAAVFRYQQTVLNAYVEVVNQMAQIDNLNRSFQMKSEQVAKLDQSIDIAQLLFTNARADYTEVLLTQRDALESKIELVELKQRQVNAIVQAYKALGGGAPNQTPDATTESKEASPGLGQQDATPPPPVTTRDG